MTTRTTALLAFTAALGLALAGPACADAAAKLLPAQSQIVFVSKQLGVPVEGQFKRFDAQIDFDPRKPETGRIALTIDTGSAAIGVPETDAELPKPEWFGVAKFPKATFESTRIKGLGGAKFEVAGKLTVKGKTQNVVVPVTLAQSGGTSTASGSFAIKRLAFDIGGGEWNDPSLVADEVQVKFKLAVSGLAPL